METLRRSFPRAKDPSRPPAARTVASSTPSSTWRSNERDTRFPARGVHRRGEFASAWQSAEFDLLTWGIVLVFSGGAFALVTVLLVPSGRVLPLPLFVGLVCGVAVVASFGFGFRFANHLQRSAGIPWPLIAVTPGVAAGGATVALALVTRLFSGDAHAGT